ncbi:hypothetical protein [Marilutibacter aestuarii]|uniref:Uncharacterized protein n=1 Tax=Marilutibacter aestuarii TaxID=1706195 RepID=A0A508AQJ3_9GAMM|nr:hypothetical protein [Lysobacter aestuarii]TQD50771.1 hypothetical protein FKV25_03360 [Lysobacter aestuarii]
MRLATPPPDVPLPPRHPHDGLMRALSLAQAVLAREVATLARAQSAGDVLWDAIDLPAGSPAPQDRSRLAAAAPLYFASELENAGLLATAEQVAGLFASGAIVQPLGPVSRQLNDFWRARRERLDAGEREAIFARAIEPAAFVPQMGALCEAIVAQADGSDLRERIVLEAAADTLGAFLAQRVDPMAAMASREIVETINLALGFLRDRMLQSAFGVQSLWQLLAIHSQGRSGDASRVQRHVDQGRAGQTVLLWLAGHAFDPAPQVDPGDLPLVGAAQRWLAGRAANRSLPGPVPGAVPALPVAA